jgi:hypothetical protein
MTPPGTFDGSIVIIPFEEGGREGEEREKGKRAGRRVVNKRSVEGKNG